MNRLIIVFSLERNKQIIQPEYISHLYVYVHVFESCRGLQLRVHNKSLFVLFLNQDICCGYLNPI